jgi:CRISPR-associated Cas5-like protein
MKVSFSPEMMKLTFHPFHVYLEGDFACFTRFPFTVCNDTYDIPTVPALKGILRSFCWKIKRDKNVYSDYVIDELRVLNPIQKTTMSFNGVKRKISSQALKAGGVDILRDGLNTRKTYVVIQNPSYIVSGHIILRDENGVICADPEGIAYEQWKHLKDRVQLHTPYGPLRFGTKFDVTDYMWLEESQLQDKAMAIPYLPTLMGETIFRNHLVDKVYNPLWPEHGAQFIFGDVVMNDGIVKFGGGSYDL